MITFAVPGGVVARVEDAVVAVEARAVRSLSEQSLAGVADLRRDCGARITDLICARDAVVGARVSSGVRIEVPSRGAAASAREISQRGCAVDTGRAGCAVLEC